MEVASLSSTGPRIFLAGERGLRAAMELVADSLDARERHPPARNHHIAGVKASDFNLDEHPRSDADASLLLVKLRLGGRHVSNLVLYKSLTRTEEVFALRPFGGMGDVVAFVYKDDDRELLVAGHWCVLSGLVGDPCGRPG